MKKLKIFKVISISAIALFVTQGCIPILPIPPSGGVPNSNIIHRVYNHVVVDSIGYAFDVDGNGVNDFNIFESTFYQIAQLIKPTRNDIQFAVNNDNNQPQCLYSYAYNETLANSNVKLGTDNSYYLHSMVFWGDIPKYPASKNADQTIFLGFVATDSVMHNAYYGWIRYKSEMVINESTPLRLNRITIIESGISTKPNIPIKAGEY